MSKIHEKIIVTLFTIFFISSWPIKRGLYNLPTLIMSKAPDYVGSVFFEHVTLMNLIKYLLIIVCILYIILNFRSVKISKQDTLMQVFFISFLLYLTITLFIFNRFDSISYKVDFFMELLSIEVIIYIICKTKININRIIKIIAYANSMAIFLQFLIYNKNIQHISDLRIYRFTGTVISPILASILIVYGIILIIWEKERLYKTKSFIMIITCILTGSRTWIIPLAISLLFITVKNINIKRFISDKKITYKKLLIDIFFTIILLMALIGFKDNLNYYINNYYVTMFEETAGIGNNSPREIKKDLAQNLFNENPILGNGTNSYSYYQYNITGSKSNPHNIYYEILCENGIVGLFLFILFIISILYNSIKNKNQLSFILIISWCLVATTIGMLEFIGLLMLIMAMKVEGYNKNIILVK